MNFDGFKPYEISRFSSLVEQDDPTVLPVGVAGVARNIRFHLTSARTRDGLQAQWGFSTKNQQPITGLAGLKLDANPTAYVPIVYDQSGALFIESPVGSGRLQPVASTQVTPPGFSMQVAAAYKKGYLAFTDLLRSQGAPAVYNIQTGALDPFTQLPVGAPWAANTVYQVGQVVTPATPVGGNSHSYRCTVPGASGAAQPVFPVTEGGVVSEGPSAPQLQWTETTPVMGQSLQQLLTAIPVVARSAGAGAFAAGRDVYIAITLVNGNGETVPSPIFSFVNTVLNDRFIVTSPVLPAWVLALLAPFACTGYNVYEADVPTGNAAPALTAFKKVNGGVVAIGVNTNVDTTGAGAAPPLVDGARIVPVGNICSGQRYGLCLFVNRNGNISGVGEFSFFAYNAPGNGLQLYCAHVPTGPAPSTAARILAFTPAGQLSGPAGTGITTAGPYFWIEPKFPNGVFDLTTIAAGVTVADVVNGVSMTSTLINDNVTTSATFNFTDDYLKATLNDVSSYFRKIQITAADDVVYLESIKRLAVADPVFPSGWRLSLPDDAESFYGDSGFFQAAENNGQHRTAIREWGSTIYPMKERGGFTLTPSADDPTKWECLPKWKGSGPCGPRAVDVCTEFMCYAHRSGVYVFKGTQPLLISKELPITWGQVNWLAEQTIWVAIDDETREIRVGVPLGQNVTAPNVVLKCNYEESPDFAPPIHFSPYIGKEIASGASYKWSIDDIAANVCVRAERPLANPPANYSGKYTDLAFLKSQVLYGSSNPDGQVSAVMPGVFNDFGAGGKVGIDSRYETAAPGELMRPSKLGGVQANLDGSGDTWLTVLAGINKSSAQGGLVPNAPPLEIKLKKPFNPQKQKGKPGFSCGAHGNNERFRLAISNNKQADAWFDIRWAAIMAETVSSAAPK